MNTSSDDTEELPRGQIDDGHEGPTPKLVTSLLTEALKVSATAVHLDPGDDGSWRVRLRIGPDLQDGQTVIPRGSGRGVIGRLKVIAGMDIAERKLPQEGTFTTEFETGNRVEWRLTTVPGRLDEKLTVRPVPLDTSAPRLDELVTGDGDMERIRTVLETGQGLMLIAGPRWSGREQLLDACVRELVRPERGIVSIEESPRAAIAGVHQVVVRPDIGMDTAAALRASVRSDVDTIRVHSLHHVETLSLALDAALDGCLVLATIPTTDAESAVMRLLEASIPPALVADGVPLVIGMRQIRRRCPDCRQSAGDAAFSSTGCETCGESGYRGHVAVYQVAPIDDTVAVAIRSGDRGAIIAAMQTTSGTLRDAALRLADAGEISTTDAIRETPDPR